MAANGDAYERPVQVSTYTRYLGPMDTLLLFSPLFFAFLLFSTSTKKKAPWSAPAFRPFLLQSLSVATHTHVAGQIHDRACDEASCAFQAA